MAQQGELCRIHGSWLVRYYDGKTRKMKKLGRVADYPTKGSIFPAYQSFMSEVNKPNFQPTVGTLLRDCRFEPTVTICSLEPSAPARGGDECPTSLVDHGVKPSLCM